MPIHSYHYFQEARAAQAENSHGKLETKIEIGKTVLLLSCSTIILIATVLATKKIVLPSLSNPSTMFALLKIVLSLRTEKEFERLFSREGYIHGLCFLEPTLSIYFTSHFSRCAYQHISHVAYFCGFRF